ncbi:MAG: hypothetical protein JST48_09320 [Bacteroidetes bacterium]|nr:hypothetical protein [Bacteroidota bacterium]
MKKIIFICLLCPSMLLAQKPIKPSVAKAEAALLKGTLDEAKQVIDATVSNQEYMVDKKGNPSKNSAKAWYLKGVIYAAIDTTNIEKYKSLEANPFPIVKESFTKSEEIDKGKNESLVNALYQGTQLPIPVTKSTVSGVLAQKYLEKAVKLHQAKDYKAAFTEIEKTLFFVPTDTTCLLYAGAYFAPQAKEDDKAITYIKKYLSVGGTNPDASLQLFNTYFNRKDWNSALEAIHVLTNKYPDNIDYLNSEYNVYVQTNNLEGAKALMLKRANGDPNDTESRYFLALIGKKAGKTDEVKHWIEEVLKINSDHFEGNEEMAILLNNEARALNDQRNASNDTKKRLDLRNQRYDVLKKALPYADKCVMIKSTDETSLYTLLSLYENLSSYDEAFEKKAIDLKKKMKAQGLEVD